MKFRESFEIAYSKVIIGHELGYVNDPDDPGGETWDGISRVHNPDWDGWKIIDAMKNNPDFPKCLDRDQQLLQLKKKLYYDKYFVKAGLELYNNDAIVTKLFDIAVNMGVSKAILFLQQSLNVLNIDPGQADLDENGKLDGYTVNATQTYIARSLLLNKRNYDISYLLNVINGFQMKHYLEVMKKLKKARKYRGWFKRVEIKW